MMRGPRLDPDLQNAIDHITWLTRRWPELGEPCEIEIRTMGEGLTPQSGRFPPSAEGIERAAKFALDMSKLPGRNSYMVVNPVRPGVGSASDADVIASFFHWADADNEEAVANLRAWVGPQWRGVTVTGVVPFTRVHVFFELTHPTRDMEAWRRTQTAIAERFCSDKSVINPSRVLAIGGTQKQPSPKKRAKGYINEYAEFRALPERPLVGADDMARAFAVASQPEYAPSRGGLLLQRTPDPIDREKLSARIENGESWRPEVLSLVASCVARNWSDDEILTYMAAKFTWPGYTEDDTRRDILALLKWVRAKEARDGVHRDFTGGGARQEAYPPPDPEQVEALQFAPWQVMDLSAIPRVQFVYSDFYARGYSSVTIAPPKQGKSMLALAEAIDMATGRGILTGVPDDPRAVLYYNAEDDQNVLYARVAALLTLYDIPQEEIAGRLYVVSGVDAEGFYLIDGEEGMVDEALFVALEKFIHASGVDAVIFDPLQDLSNSPETNEVFRRLGRRLRKMASSMGIAIGLVHHTRKVAPGMAPTIDDGRGGSALRGTARFNRVLAGMTEDEALKAGVDNHRLYVRIGDAESNLAPPSADINRWFEKVSVTTPSGENVGAVRPWKWPDAFDGVTAKDAARVRAAVSAAFDADPMQCRADVQAKLWVGRIVAETLGMDADNKQDRERIKTMIRTWLDSGVLAREVAFDPDKRQDRPVIAPGPTRPGEAE